MTFTGSKRVFALAALFAAALLSMACEGPNPGKPAAGQQGGTQPPSTGSGMVVKCSVCKGVGSYVRHDGIRRECDNCNGRGTVKYTK